MTIYEVLQKQIEKTYGMSGRKIGSVLIPAFLGDFKKVLDENDLGATVSEEYMTEDKKMHLVFKGQRRMAATGYEYVVISCVCNGAELLLEEQLLWNR